MARSQPRHHQPGRRPGITATVIALTLLTIVMVGALIAFHSADKPRAATPPPSDAVGSYQPVPTLPAARTSPPTQDPNRQLTTELTTSFATLAATIDGVIGIATAPVGATEVISLGDWNAGPAWSTAKVPVVLAAMRDQPDASPTAEMQAAIAESDNQAAEQVWASLGDPVTAAAKVEKVLQGAHDPTPVQSERIRPGFTAFGQTIWPLTDQVTFLSTIACDPNATSVIDLMNLITSSQRWGIGTIANAKFKGGWGPSPQGQYLVRQFGLIPTTTGTVAVAIAAEPTSGEFTDGIHQLDMIAGWLALHVDALPAGHCA